jgi:tRNA threonylcarbamoyladenosine biosynthesis protein TsaB
MALILNIETSTDSCSVAISKGGNSIAALKSNEQRSHASVLTVLIEELLHKNNISVTNLDAVCVSKGPGSYTGLRIGVSAAKGICYGILKPLIAINTLECMMNGLSLDLSNTFASLPENSIFCPMLDARRLEVYLAMFQKNGTPYSETSAVIIQEDSFMEDLKGHKIVFFGNGAEKCKPLITSPNAVFFDNFTLNASHMANLSEELFQKRCFEDLAYFEPFYLKDFVATIPKRKVL